jgi:hypothetical protein
MVWVAYPFILNFWVMNFKLTATQIGIRMSRSKLFIRCQRLKKKILLQDANLLPTFQMRKKKTSNGSWVWFHFCTFIDILYLEEKRRCSLYDTSCLKNWFLKNHGKDAWKNQPIKSVPIITTIHVRVIFLLAVFIANRETLNPGFSLFWTAISYLNRWWISIYRSF